MCDRRARMSDFPNAEQMNALLDIYGSCEHALLAWRQHGPKATVRRPNPPRDNPHDTLEKSR